MGKLLLTVFILTGVLAVVTGNCSTQLKRKWDSCKSKGYKGWCEGGTDKKCRRIEKQMVFFCDLERCGEREPEVIPATPAPEVLPEVLEPQVLPEVLEPPVLPEVLEPEVLPEVLEPPVLPEVLEPQVLPEVLEPQVLPEEPKCVEGEEYRGDVAITKNGATCQRWSRQTPYTHIYLPEDYPDSGLGDHNYCRDPSNEGAPWCYTVGSTRWDWCFEECAQPEPEEPKCVEGEEYRGDVAITKNGATCQRWSSQTPYTHIYLPENYPDSGLGDHNYCRDPSNEGAPWCYTTGSTRWDWCFEECVSN